MTLRLPPSAGRGAAPRPSPCSRWPSPSRPAAAAASSGDGVVSLAGPSATPGPSAAPAASVDPEEAMQAFTDVHARARRRRPVVDRDRGQRRHGRPDGAAARAGPTRRTDPQPAPARSIPKAMEAADKACRDLLPAGGMLGDPNATMDPALADQMLAFAQCMRDHGDRLPGPEVRGRRRQHPGRRPAARAGASTPPRTTFQAAQEACGSELPGGGPFGWAGPRRAERAGDRGQAVRGSLIAGAGLVLVVAAGADRRRLRRRSRRSWAGGAATPSPVGGFRRGPSTPHPSSDGRWRRPRTSTARWPTRASRPVVAGTRGHRDPPARSGHGHRRGRRALRARRPGPPAPALRRPAAVAPAGPGRSPTAPTSSSWSRTSRRWGTPRRA